MQVLKTLIFILLMTAEHLSSGHIFIHIITGCLILSLPWCRAIMLGETLSVMAITVIDFLEWKEKQERIRNVQKTLFCRHELSKHLESYNYCQGGQCDMLPIGHTILPITHYRCHTHCSYGYSTATTPNWNATLWSGYSSTICDILHFLHRSSSCLLYYNWEFTSMTSINLSTPVFTISTVYPLRNLWLMEKPNTEGNWWSNGDLHFNLYRNQKGSWTTPSMDTNVENEDWPESSWLTLAIITQSIYQGNPVLTLLFISILAYWIKCIIGYIAGTLKISLI